MTDYKNPKGGLWKPHGGYNPEGSLWIRMDAWTLTQQAAWGRGPIVAEYAGDSFTFLAPKEFIESTAHEWADYESLMGRLAQKAGELEKEGRTTGQTFLAGAAAAKEIFTTMDVTSEAMKAAVAKAGGEITVFNQRYDAPLYYKGSSRRKFDLIFYLVEEGDPEEDVVEPVRRLQSLSSPKKQGMLYGIEPPRIFEIQSEPDNDFLYIEYAALKSVQPTWRGPYIGGWPSSCELQLSFEDMTPLFEDSFGASYVNVRAVGPPVPPTAKGAAIAAATSLAPRVGNYTGEVTKYNKIEQNLVANLDGPSSRGK